ncbi:MAG: hypothetical protein M5R41_16960 [Bacteroidia bacterium]|nr:hypothetical protein [Bacteroidia bacterium]
MHSASFSFRILRLLLAVIVPVMGLMAQRHHAHLETVHHEHASHPHEHPHEHSDEPHSHDHQPVDLFLQMTATALTRSSGTSEIPDHPAYCDTFLLNLLADTRPDLVRQILPFPTTPPQSAVREELLRRAANLPPPALT